MQQGLCSQISKNHSVLMLFNMRFPHSHSSTESEIISLDTGLRLDGLHALELWDLIVSVLGNVSRVSDRSGQPDNDDHKHHKSQKKINLMETLIPFPQMSKLRVKKLYCMCLRTMKQ